FSEKIISGGYHEKITIHRKPNLQHSQRSRCRRESRSGLPKTRHQQCHPLQLESQIWWHGHLRAEAQANHQWALDFMHDSLYCGKRFRTLNVLDEGTRECLAIEVDTSLPAERVVRTLEHLKMERGLPAQLGVDNGPELISAKLTDWCEENAITLVYIQPGKPQQNGFVERFNGSFRRE